MSAVRRNYKYSWEELNPRTILEGKNILFVTNNSSKSRETYKKAFDGFGIQASVVGRSFIHCIVIKLFANSVRLTIQDEIFGSAYASAIYLSKILNFPVDKKVYVIGTKGIEDELKSVGINFTGGSVRIERRSGVNNSLTDLIAEMPFCLKGPRRSNTHAKRRLLEHQ